jgi:hypothetical protein
MIEGCLKAAAEVDHVPAGVLVLLISVEAGRLGAVSQNANGTVDIGPMQVNDTWLSKIAEHWGVSREEAYRALRDSFCANVEGGAWDAWRQVHKVAGEQLDIGMDGAELDLAGVQRVRDRGSLRARIGEVELACDAPLEQVEMGLENDPRLHDMKIADSRRVDAREDLGKEIGLLLVVALEADPVAGTHDRFEKRLRAFRRHQLAA